MSENTFIKDPQSQLDYTFDWAALTNGTGDSDWLENGESIDTHSVSITNGLTEVQVGVSDNAVTVWVSGGTAGEDYTITCRITTDNTPARTDERTITILVREQ